MSSSACLNNILMRRRHCASKYYSVFLNFGGKDTRHNFVRPLHKALCLEGINAFKDDINLNKGNWIRKELFGAIEACRIAIVVLSKNYATSTWCLDELARIMKYENNHNNRTIFPVFYDVCPSDVRHLRGSFAQAFNQHEVNHRIDPKKVKIWKRALRGAAEISGFELLNHVYKG
ncbi:PREDICTED: toll/interleukin-1 receptor-like protein [Ipomoea nil]|uniref:toll/interleukin-1 receptor-like protein n=1 Tax=Ipomoea nil TaxID=35883 RepID=UPI000900E87A|nr:PREDICTED: toll/interleukin-1 receptor-like protein [Ipomoea nil]